VATDAGLRLLVVVDERGPGEVVSALEWAEIRALASDGVSQRKIGRRLGINRRTVARALGSDGPPRMRVRLRVRSWIR
jgi:DNA invertase Pin-like site-specific DNA recombinase